MDETTNLQLPYIMAAQAQKHVTHNEAIRALDCLVHLSVLDRDLATSPATPADGDRYIVAAGGTGAWAGRDLVVAAFQDAAWAFYPPREGWTAWVADEDLLVVWDGSAWVVASSGGGGSVNPTSLVGVNATADAANRLTVASPASLFNHDGAGHQIKVNKAAAADTASLLFQTGFSGRAEMGLTGDDDYHFKVSADGTTWLEAITIDKDTGEVTFPHTTIGGGGGGGGLKLIATATVSSAVAQVDFTGLPTGTYDSLLVEISGLKTSTDNNHLCARFGTGGTPTMLTSAYEWTCPLFGYTGVAVYSSDAASAVGSAITDRMVLCPYGPSTNGIGSGANKAFSGQYWVTQLGAGDRPRISGAYSVTRAFDNRVQTGFAGGGNTAAHVVTALQFFLHSGNITAGTFRLYGLAKV